MDDSSSGTGQFPWKQYDSGGGRGNHTHNSDSGTLAEVGQHVNNGSLHNGGHFDNSRGEDSRFQ